MIWNAGILQVRSHYQKSIFNALLGHGNFYESLYNSGLLDQFIKDGKKYCFLSNIDNLGATVDFVSSISSLFPHILLYFTFYF